jgi:hypothetical protein
VLLPDSRVEPAPVSARVRVYPLESLVLTVTVSLAMVWAPEPVGSTFTLTVPLVVSRLIIGLRFELIVVEAVRAETAAVEPKIKIKDNVETKIVLMIFKVKILTDFLIF